MYHPIRTLLENVDKCRCLSELRGKDDTTLIRLGLSPELIKGDINSALAYLFPHTKEDQAEQENRHHKLRSLI